MNRFILFIAALVFGTTAYSGEELYSSRIEGANIYLNNSFDVYDVRYFDMSSNPAWMADFSNQNVKNTVQLGLNPEVLHSGQFTVSVDVSVTYEHWNLLGFTSSTENRTLSINYDDTDPVLTIDDLSTYVFSGGHMVSVEITGITGIANVDDVFLESKIEVERYYNFDGGTVDNASYIEFGTGLNYVEFNWDAKYGAESYELEWVHINDYTSEEDVYIAEADLDYNFYLNSTRIEIKDNWYKIPKIFDHGYLIFRVRAIGVQGQNFDYRYDGEWNGNEIGNISTYPADQKLYIDTEYDQKMNWSHQVGYTENGKRMEAVSFADGLGRGRQTVAHNTATEQVIVSNVYYDELGRPVISDLPTPVEGENILHYPDFNLAESNGLPYQEQYFDDPTNPNGCVTDAQGFSTTSGAGQYYSSQNPDLSGENANIPDAENFPFSRVTYLEDYTGRVLRVGAAGNSLRIGSGKETRYVYPSSNQTELNKLFGTEVGDYTHYQKMVTVDPNGQTYCQYSDLAGRVVASYMLGASPDNLNPLSNNALNPVQVDLLVNGNYQTETTPIPSTTLTYTEYIADNDTYTLTYGFTPAQYTNACLPVSICFDCVYDLSIKVTDECGDVIVNYLEPINGSVFNEICDGEIYPGYSEILPLSKGEYVIEKHLAVNQASIDEYWCLYIDNEICTTPLTSFFNDDYVLEPFDACDNLDYTTYTSCELAQQLMLSDVSPGGQYGEYEVVAGVYTALDQTYGIVNWDTPGEIYYDEFNNVVVMSTLEDFITNFREEWASQLLQHHPEKCYLDFCSLQSPSQAHDDAMLATLDFTTAISAGFFNPVGNSDNSLLTEFFSISSSVDPFFTGIGAAYNVPMKTLMESYIIINGTSLTMWQYAVYLAEGCDENDVINCIRLFDSKDDCSRADLVWVTFRALYLEAKANYIYQAQQDYVNAQGCANDCIGSLDVGCEDLADNTPRFPNANLPIGTSGTSINDILGSTVPNPQTAGQAVYDQMILDYCQSSAEQYAIEWMANLSGCNFTGVDVVALENDMISLLISTCDGGHPTVASTSNGVMLPSTINVALTYSSLDELLIIYLGAGYEDNLCTPLLISQPGPYQDVEVMGAAAYRSLDECACDLVYEAYEIGQDLGIPIEEAMLQLTGLNLDDVDFLLCECDKMSGDYSQWSLPTFSWDSFSYTDTDWENLGINIPFELACETSDCDISCTQVNTDVQALNTQFIGVTDFENSVNYQTILTNYLNQTYNYTLAYPDYSEFIAKCGADANNPYCSLNPLMTEWAEVMTLVAHRGQLLNDNLSTVDLNSENIVYAQNDIANQFSGDDFWTSVNGSTLTFHYGTAVDNCTIDITGDPAFDFNSVVSFGAIIPQTTDCNTNSQFEVAVQYIDCGQLTTTYLTGNSNCFDVVECVCDATSLMLCNEPIDFQETPCYEPLLSEMYQNALDDYFQEVNAEYDNFKEGYNLACAEAFNTENFNYTGNVRAYQYTLFYYDQAGNLVKTIAPEGVDFMDAIDFPTIDAIQGGVVNSSSTGALLPAHDYATTYKYNSYNQLIETTNPDQEGDTKFWYDRYGRIVASQNPVQAEEDKYSYSFYDAQGRPVQVGQVVQLTALIEGIVNTNDITSADFVTWVTGGTTSEITITQYDESIDPSISALFANGQQENLRLRVASVFYYTVAGAWNSYESATHYSYDIHGNVIEQLQDVPVLAIVEQDIKSTQYEFELISGNVKKVSYQKGERDYFSHDYKYDELNRLTEVFTSSDDVHSTREAHYLYYDYGPLARTEIGQYKVQGSDFAYTINGWLKGMNASTLDVNNDMGHDGVGGYQDNTSVHNFFAADVNAYTMGYFKGDYTAIDNTSSMEMTVATNDNFYTGSTDLFNGNISHVVNSIHGMTTMGNAYTYDQLQRLTSMTSYYNVNTNNSWSNMIATQDYYNDYSYDKNGNIKTLQRNGTAVTGLLMDEFDYNYMDVYNPTTQQFELSNRLEYVSDSGADDAIVDPAVGDIKTFTGIGEGMTDDNYTYDKIGQLLSDVDEGILNIEWRSGDKKIKKIIRTSQDLLSSQVEFIYNPFGVRVLKIEKPRANGSIVADQNQWKYSYYGYDANGQTMAVYDVKINTTGTNNVHVNEHHIYGSSRIGMHKSAALIYHEEDALPVIEDVLQNEVGNRNYECTNHLGNVQAVITDRKMVAAFGSPSIYEAVVIMTSDYYPFGMVMPGFECQDVVGVAELVYTENYFDTDGDAEGWVGCSGAVSVVGGNLEVNGYVNSGNWLACASYDITGVGTIVTGDEIHFEIDVANLDFPDGGIYMGLGSGFNLSNGGILQEGINTFTVTADAFGGVLDNLIFRVYSSLGGGDYNFDINSVKVWKTEESTINVCRPRIQIGDYRYGYNGMEKDDEVKGDGNSYTTQFRQYDPRLGRWLSLDPLMKQFPNMSPYCAFDNNPIYYVDPYGLYSKKQAYKKARKLNRKGITDMAYITMKAVVVDGGDKGYGILLIYYTKGTEGDVNWNVTYNVSYKDGGLPHSPDGETHNFKTSEAINITFVYADRASFGEVDVSNNHDVVPNGIAVIDGTVRKVWHFENDLMSFWDSNHQTLMIGPDITRGGGKILRISKLGRAGKKIGRAGKQSRLRELSNDPKLGSADRGWIKSEMNQMKNGNRKSIRNPPGKEMAHERGREAAKNYSYKHSNLQDKNLHKTQHKYDKNGTLNTERPIKDSE